MKASPHAARRILAGSVQLSSLTAKADGPVEGAVVFVEGLAAGSTLSVGRPSGTTRWSVAAADFPKASIRPPSDFVGFMDVVLELRHADDSLLDRKSVRLEWSPQQSVAGQEQSGGNPTRQLDRQEVADLTRRGEKFIVIGDLASARLMLQRAAEAGDPRAALMLAATYDPIVLEKVGIQGFAPDLVQGFAPDIAVARSWYARAREFGSTEAVRRLQGFIEPIFAERTKRMMNAAVRSAMPELRDACQI